MSKKQTSKQAVPNRREVIEGWFVALAGRTVVLVSAVHGYRIQGEAGFVPRDIIEGLDELRRLLPVGKVTVADFYNQPLTRDGYKIVTTEEVDAHYNNEIERKRLNRKAWLYHFAEKLQTEAGLSFSFENDNLDCLYSVIEEAIEWGKSHDLSDNYPPND